MADRSKIEWTDASWNPIRARNLKTGKIGWHCEHATTGCEFCYSEGFNKRLGTGLPYKPGHRKDIEIFLDEQMLTQPLRWKKPRRIFVCSMTDAFADFVTDEMLDKMFAVAALCPQHTLQFLTKRAKRMRSYFAGDPQKRIIGRTKEGNSNVGVSTAKSYHSTTKHGGEFAWPLPNVWIGVSAERQQEADERIPELLATPAAARFISAEPLLGPIDLTKIMRRAADDDWTYCDNALTGFRAHKCGGSYHAKLDWVIVGGESGRDARSMHPDWARALRDQCAAAKVAFFFKQFGEWAPSTPEDAKGNPHSGWMANAAHPHVARESELYPEAGAKFIARVGKAAAGRLLDGIEHNEFPRVPA